MKRFTLPVLYLSLCLLVNSSFTEPGGYVIGDTADDFSLKNVNGNMVTLADYKDAKGYIVVFTCNHCPYAQMYEDRIIALSKKYLKKGYPVIAINPNSPEVVEEDSYEEMQKRAKEFKYPFPYLFDENQEVYPKFGATRTPHVFILDKELKVRYIGAIDDNPELPKAAKNHWVERAMDSLLSGSLPNPDFTRAVGCTVKKKPE